jgi:16S rRNA (guanine527-N7)-methyltransferase
VLDTLELSKLLRAGEEVLDVGTGGGVPGVVLSIVRPDLQVTLCESVGKKAAAVEQIIRQLKLETPLYPNRAEEVLEDLRFDACVGVTRAFGTTSTTLSPTLTPSSAASVSPRITR